MAFVFNFYKEVEMETVVYSFPKSIIAFTSASPFSIPPGEPGSAWSGGPHEDPLLDAYVGEVGANTQGITISGTPLFDYITMQTRPYNEQYTPDNYWTSDKKTENGQTIYFAGFMADLGTDNTNRYGTAFQFSWRDRTADYYDFNIERYFYIQSPAEGERQTWKYWDTTDGFPWDQSAKSQIMPVYKEGANSGQGKIFLCTTTIGEKEYIVFVANTNIDGSVNNKTWMYMLPRSVSMPSESEPYVGPVSKESVEESFLPEDERHDIIESRTITDTQRSCYGLFAGGTGYKLLIANTQNVGLDILHDNLLPYIFGNIFRGNAAGLINKVEQGLSTAFNGNSHRPAEEVSAMVDAIVCCHSIPVLRDGYTSYAEGWSSINSLGGYPFDLNQFGLNYYEDETADYATYLYKVQNMGISYHNVWEWHTYSELITQRLNCFLDFEPYTTMTLKLPFLQPISVPSNLVYGNRIKVHTWTDILTGFMVCDVFLGDNLYTSLSTNIKTDIPIIGQGANGGGLSKITTAIGNMASGAAGLSSGNLSGISSVASGSFELGNAVSKFNSGIVIGKEGNPALTPLVSTRSGYLFITHPKASVPSDSETGKITSTFLNQVGMAANLSYKVQACGPNDDGTPAWNVFSSVDLSSIQAPDYIKQDILSRLKSGVFIK